MMKNLKVGDIITISLCEDLKFVHAIILHLSKRYRSYALIGVLKNFSNQKFGTESISNLQFLYNPFYLNLKSIDSNTVKVQLNMGNLSEIDAITPELAAVYDLYFKDKLIRRLNLSELSDYKREGFANIHAVVSFSRHHLGLPEISSEVMDAFWRDSVSASNAPNQVGTNPKPSLGIDGSVKMPESDFWTAIESSFPKSKQWKAARVGLLTGDESDTEDLLEGQSLFLKKLRKALSKYTKEQLLAFDRTLEHKLYDIDRQDIQEHTDGSDDGFLYARGFIVSMGREYYELVNTDPSKAFPDLEFEEFCYFSKNLYEEKYGPMPTSTISRESTSNKAGWKE
jgi:Protein of unknown function (DUF4240)